MKRTAFVLLVIMITPAFAVADPSAAPSPEPRSPEPPVQGPASSRANATDYSDVMLLINNRSAMSMRIGAYFKARRNIPDKNICNISMPTSEWISQAQFGTVRTAVEGWINDSGLNNSLNYIVTTKGDPLGVWGSAYTYASFMDELGLILGPYASVIGNNGWMNNPFGGSEARFSRQKFGIFIVTRIDGYDLDDCLRLIDLASNATGSRGTFVLDSQPWHDGGGYQDGNDWCREANTTLTEKGWTVYLDDTPWYVVNQKNVSGYCSWGSNDGNAGNYAKPGFTWVPGAYGSTYVSTSARSFAYPPSYGQSLIADLVREGITGVHGNVAEPFLDACARPQYFLERSTRGWNLGESIYAGMATQSWQNCVIGDPKIEPYSDQPDPAILPEDIGFSAPSIVEGMNVTVTATVRNLGGGTARNTTVTFFLDGPPENGGRRIGENITIPLIPAGGNQTVLAGWDTSGPSGLHGIVVRLNVSRETPELRKGNDEARRDANVFNRPELVLPREKFSVSALSPVEGDRVWINASVKNTGGYPATTELRYLVNDTEVGNRSITLAAGQETADGYRWNTQGSPGAHRIAVQAVPVPYESDPSNNNLSIDLFVRSFGLAASADQASLSCLPGRSAVFNITLRSLANTAETVVVSLSPAPPFWTGAVEPEKVSLGPKESSVHRVTVTTPDLGTVLDRWDMSVRCEGLTSGLIKEVNLSVGILPVLSVQLSCDPETSSALPGENATFKLNARNLGNGACTVLLSFEAPPGWEVSFEDGALSLPHQGSASALFKVRPPASALAGETATVTLLAEAAGGALFNTSVQVETEQSFGVEASLGPQELTLRPGDEAQAVLVINNTGNGPETVTVALPSTELALGASDRTLEIAAFSSRNVTLTVKVPDKYLSPRENLQIGVETPRVARVGCALSVTVVRPDLALPRETLVVSPASPVEGQAVTITFDVQNGGTAGSGPVTVRLFEFNTAVASGSLENIEPGGKASVTLRWNATTYGTHELRATAGCGYRDPTPKDGSLSVTLTVARKKTGGDGKPEEAGPSTAILAGGAILVAAAVALVAVFLLRRRPPASAAGGAGRHEESGAGFSLIAGDDEESDG